MLGPCWMKDEMREKFSYKVFLEDLAANKNSDVLSLDTQKNRLLWMFKNTMGCGTTFELRRCVIHKIY